MGGEIIMKFVVDYKKTQRESKFLPIGEHEVEIKFVNFKEIEEQAQLPNGENVLIERRNINILLENDEGEIVWDTIFHNLEGEYLLYDEYRLNMYSVALEIPDGTVFKTIEEWVDYIKGRRVIANIVENNYTNRAGVEVEGVRVSFLKSVNEGVEQEPEPEPEGDDLPF